jgi:Lrp/AsnC family leucine-responsive transcriptional regulator
VYASLRRRDLIDDTDKRIVETLQKNCRLPLEQVAKELKIPKATLHYRIRRLEKGGIIEGYNAKIDASKLGKDFATITFVRAKYGPGYHKKLGKKLAQIPGVWAVYFLFGDIDFVIMARSDSSKDFLIKMEKMANMNEIVSTSTHIIAQVIKEEGGIELEPSRKEAAH